MQAAASEAVRLPLKALGAMAIFTSLSLNGFKVMMLVLCLSSCDDERRPSRIQLFSFPSFPKRAGSGRLDYIIVQVFKPSPLWYLNYRVLTTVRCRGPWVWPTPWPLGPHTETPRDAQKYFRER